MRDVEELIRRIVDESQIPSARRKRAIQRELRSHFEASVPAAREAGIPEDAILQQVLASLGDTSQVAQGFAWLYRRERAMLRIAVFLLSTLTMAIMLSVTVLALQAGVAFGFGSPLPGSIARHTVIEALDILSTVAAYVGFISIEKLFDTRRFQKALAVLALTFAIAAAGSAAENIHAPFPVFGFVSGVFLRALQVLMRNSLARSSVAATCFAAASFFSMRAHASTLQYAVILNCVSWLVMGAGYQLMADFAPRFDEALWNGLRNI